MLRQPPESTRTCPLSPAPTVCRAHPGCVHVDRFHTRPAKAIGMASGDAVIPSREQRGAFPDCPTLFAKRLTAAQDDVVDLRRIEIVSCLQRRQKVADKSQRLDRMKRTTRFAFGSWRADSIIYEGCVRHFISPNEHKSRTVFPAREPANTTSYPHPRSTKHT